MRIRRQQLDRDRKQWTGAATYFLDTAKGSHTFKMGGELLKEQSWEGFLSRRGGTSNIEQVYNNGNSTQVIFGLPTATSVGSLKDNDNGALTSRAALDQIGFFINDTWQVGRVTINGGVRYDYYKGWLPEQQQLGATVGRASVDAKTFPQTDLFTWNQVAPRVGFIYDLSGDGRTVVKANYGLYWHNPGVSVPASGNANIASKSSTWNWNDQLACAGCIAGDKRWQPGEETTFVTAALEGAIRVDPNIKAPYSHEAAVWFERQLNDSMGARAGFVYKTEDDLIDTFQPGRGPEVFTVPFDFTDIGVDGRAGTADDKIIRMLGLPAANANTLFPADQVVMNVPRYGRYKTIEVSTTKRFANKWSAQVGGGYTMLTNFPNDLFPNNPNMPGVQDRSTWGLKAIGSYEAPWGIRLSPVLRHQSGVNFARTVVISTTAAANPVSRPDLIATSGTGDRQTAYAEPADANREDNIWVFDVRTEKTITLNSRTRIRAYLDLFNITNSHASETIGRATGLSYLKPTLILAPFTARVGFRFIF